MVYATFLDETLEVFGKSYQKRVVYDDNLIDRINHYYTNMLLFIFVVVVGTPELVGYYIECWCPEHFEKVQVDYVNYLCWISNTYYIPMSKPIPESYEIRASHKIYYYQWTPLIFLVMAAMFKIPRAVWKYLSNRSGVGIKKFMISAKDTHNGEMLFNIRRTHQMNLFNAGLPPMSQTEFFPPGIDTEVERQKTLISLAKHIDLWCHDANRNEPAEYFSNTRKRLNTLFDFGLGRHHGNYLITLLLFVRFLYFVNVIGQLVLLNEFLTDDFYIYGYEVLQKFLAGKDWSLNYARFPRVTLCDFDLRQLYNIQRHTVQCVLPINLYNEKIFIILWFWLTFVAAITFLNFIFTIIRAVIKKTRENFIIKYLKLNNIYYEEKPELTNKFMHSHLKFDGIFLLQMLSINVGSAIVTDIVRHMWDEFYKRDREKKSGSDTSSYPSTISLHSSGTPKSSFYNSNLTHRNTDGKFYKNSSPTFISNPQNGNCVPNNQNGFRNSFISLGSNGTVVATEKKQMMPNETLV